MGGAIPIRIHSLRELREAEGEIVQRLNGSDRGSLLFLLDPLRAMSDVGVELSVEVGNELREREPTIGQASAAYDAIGEAGDLSVEVTLTGLFDWNDR
jgi:hypothetical protein